MGFDDEDFYKAKDVGVSDTQLYRQAGNSIVVNVLEKIIEGLLKWTTHHKINDNFFFYGVNFYNLCYNSYVYKKSRRL